MRGALDIGGTKIAVGLVDGTRLVDRDEIPTDVEAGPLCAVERAAANLAELCARNGAGPLSGLGIACAGPVNTQTGRIENPYTLPGWDTIVFTAEMASRVGAETYIEHDVATALLGTVRLHGLGSKTVVLAMFGTGVGISVIQGGALFRNRSPYHPEYGSLLLRPGGAPCYCGRTGCVEALLSGPALHRRARLLGFADFADAVRSESATARSLQQAVQDELRLLANTFAVIFQPEVFCFGGGIATVAPQWFRDGLAAAFGADYAFTAPCEIRQIDDREAALVGAAALCDRGA